MGWLGVRSRPWEHLLLRHFLCCRQAWMMETMNMLKDIVVVVLEPSQTVFLGCRLDFWFVRILKSYPLIVCKSPFFSSSVHFHCIYITDPAHYSTSSKQPSYSPWQFFSHFTIVRPQFAARVCCPLQQHPPPLLPSLSSVTAPYLLDFRLLSMMCQIKKRHLC